MLVVQLRGSATAAAIRRRLPLVAATAPTWVPTRQRHSASGGGSVDDGTLLRDSVRKVDYDNYVCGLLFPQSTRASFFAIRAMNAEVASIKDTIRANPATGKIRLQWWRDRIYDLYDRGPLSAQQQQQDTHLLRALARAIHEHALTRRWFERLLDARDEDLDAEPPVALRDLEIYADRTAASLLYLTLEVLGVRDDAADRAAGHAGVAIGLATLLRATPFHLARQQLYLPEELLARHGLTPNDVLAASEDPATGGPRLAPVVFDVACRAMEHVHAARALTSEVPRAGRPAMLGLVPAATYLGALERAHFNVFAPELVHASPLQLHWQLLKHYFLRRY